MLSSILPGPPAASQAPASPRPGSTAAASSSHFPEPSRARRRGQERAHPSALALAQDSAQGTANAVGTPGLCFSQRRPQSGDVPHDILQQLPQAPGKSSEGERPGSHVVRGTGPGKAGRKGGGSYEFHSARDQTQLPPPGLCLGQVPRPASAGPAPACITS